MSSTTPNGPGDIEASFDHLLDSRDEARAAAHKAETERDGAYRERAHLVALLAAQYPSHIGHTDPSAPDWAVVTVELPTGQACWHVAPADMDLFGHVEPTPRYARGWDGHTTDEKYERIAALVRTVVKTSGVRA